MDQSFIVLKAANGLNAVLTAGGQSEVRHLETLLSQTPLITGSITSPFMSLWATGDVSAPSDLREVEVMRKNGQVQGEHCQEVFRKAL